MGLKKPTNVKLKSVKASGANTTANTSQSITIPCSFKPTHAYVKGYQSNNECTALRLDNNSVKSTLNVGSPSGTMGYVNGLNLTENSATFTVHNNGNSGYATYSVEVYGV